MTLFIDTFYLHLEQLSKMSHIQQAIQDLKEKGYAVIPDVLNDEEVQQAIDYFYTWLNSDQQIQNHNSPHGVMQFWEVAHQQHAWYIRTRLGVLNFFKTFWNTEELVVSFDGTNHMPENLKKKDTSWEHVDQSYSDSSFKCLQAYVSLTTNTHRTFVVYEGSHKLHAEYAIEKNLTSNKKNWIKIEKDYLDKIKESKRILHVKAGSLVLWDSRTIHCNCYGTVPEERIVQYVSYLPRNNKKLTKKMQEKRQKYFLERRTTSHWAYPVKVNSLQPDRRDKSLPPIDYSVLQPPDLSAMMDEIQKLI